MEEKTIDCLAINGPDAQRILDTLHNMLWQGWQLANVERIGDYGKLYFQREIPDSPASKPALPTREAIWKMLNSQVHSAAAVEVILENLECMGVVFSDPPAPKQESTGRSQRYESWPQRDFVEPSEIPDGEAD